MGSTPVRRVLVGSVVIGGVVAGATVARHFARRRPLLAPVADELRHPFLYLDMTVANERMLRIGRRAIAMPRPIRPGVSVRDEHLPADDDGPGPRVVVYEPAQRTRPSGAVVWIHGGGLIMGTPEQGHDWCSRLADELGVVVASVGYRLAPEHPYPAAVIDCHRALRWVADHADDLGIDPARIAVGGDSAGGGLAAATCLRARDLGGPSVAFQLLNYPMLDDRTTLHDDHGGRGVFVWTNASNRFGWTSYLGTVPTATSETDAHAVPARADDLSGLPPAWIGVGDLDLFYAEDVDYAERLAAAGVACTLHVEPGMYHGADAVVGSAPAMRAYRDAMVDALRQALA